MAKDYYGEDECVVAEPAEDEMLTAEPEKQVDLFLFFEVIN